MHFLNEFRQRIHDIYVQEWKVAVNMTSDFRIYKHFKDSFQFEGYLNIFNKSFRTAITKVRLSSHLFFIERGRWGRGNIDAVDRKCIQCNIIEDEFHCLIECPRFAMQRKGCIPDNLRKRPSVHEFLRFIKCNDSAMYNKVGLLCYRTMKEYRNTYLLD